LKCIKYFSVPSVGGATKIRKISVEILQNVNNRIGRSLCAKAARIMARIGLDWEIYGF